MSRPTWDPGGRGEGCAHGAVTLCGGPFQALALAVPTAVARSRYPAGQARRFGRRPRSLAATGGITIVFSSSGY